MDHDIRPLRTEDVDDAHRVMVESFTDLSRRLGRRPEPLAPLAVGRVRIGHLLATDPGGAWVATDPDGNISGCALALMRDGLWGLSLLVVRPDAQSAGVGRELLARAWTYGAGARGAVILSSPDHRALRRYARLGLSLHPAVAARGTPRRAPAPPEVVPGTTADLYLAAMVDHKIRGAAHGADLAALLSTGAELLVVPGRGYAVLRNQAIRLLAAVDEAAAVLLLRAGLAAAGDTGVSVDWITGSQGWAVGPCLDAGLDLHLDGAVFVGGDVGPFTPYLPNGAYL